MTVFCVVIAFCSGASAVSADDQVPPPDVIIEKRGDVTNILTTTPALKEQIKLFEAIQKKPRSADAEVIAWISENADRLTSNFLFELSRRLFDKDADAAMEWFVVASTRARFDALRCADPTSRQGITFLPWIAANVEQYADNNREAYGRAGLRALARPDLLTDRVTPMWICVHGMRAVKSALKQEPLAESRWFVPEDEWPAIEDKLLATLAEHLRQQSLPQDDPVPMDARTFTVNHSPDSIFVEHFAWLTATELVIGERNPAKQRGIDTNLYLWQPGAPGAPLEIAREASGLWCAGRGNIRYETKQRRLTPRLIEFTYRFGPPFDTRKGTYKDDRRWDTPKQDMSISTQSPHVADYAQISPFTCERIRNERFSRAYKSNWLPLIGNDGFLGFSYKYREELMKPDPTVYYANNRDHPGLPLPIHSTQVLPYCVAYFDYTAAYFLQPCAIRHKQVNAFKKQPCIPYWWLKKVGDSLHVKDHCLPTDSVTANLPVMVPSRAGMLRVAKYRQTHHGRKPGEIYLTAPNGAVTKIVEAEVDRVTMSSEGCLLAYGQRESDSGRQMVSVIDVCSAGPLAGQ